MIAKKSKLKKILFVSLYVFILTFTVLFTKSIINNQISFINSWQAKASYDFEKIIETNEQGESQIVYGISTPEQLAGAFSLNKKVNASTASELEENVGTEFRLTSNIDLLGYNWIPKENSLVFDGAGFAISNLTIEAKQDNVGFVSVNYGTIKNVIFQNANVKSTFSDYSTNSYTGIVAGFNHTAGNIKNISVIGSSQCKGNDYNQNQFISRIVGGVCGLNYGTISNCINKATVTNGSHLGGICGYNENNSIISCFNYGKIGTGNQLNKTAILGGICGESKAIISKCYNSGEISSSQLSKIVDNKPQYEGEICMGGIVGLTSSEINECQNDAKVSTLTYSVNDVSADPNASYVGGIAGKTTCEIKNCFNKGQVIATAKVEENYNEFTIYSNNQEVRCHTANNYLGILTYAKIFTGVFKNDQPKRSSETSFVITRNYNAYAGGIVGYGENECINCYNIGEISGGYETTTQKKVVTFELWYSALFGFQYQDAVFYTLKYYSKIYFSGINGNRKQVNTNCYVNNKYIYNNFISTQLVAYMETGNEIVASSSYLSYGMSYSFIFGANPATSLWRAIIYYSKSASGQFYDTYNYLGDAYWYLKGNSDTGNQKVYNVVSGECTYYNYFTLNENPTADILDSNIWADSNISINNGLPYLKSLYW